MAQKQRYIVTGLIPIRHGKQTLGEGAEILLTEKQGTELLRLGAIAPEAATAEPDATTDASADSGADQPGPGAGSDPAPGERESAIRAAIAELDPANPDHWTNAGKPDATALSERLGERVSAAERDAVWDGVQQG